MNKWIVGLAAAVLAPLANATLFQYEVNNGSMSGGATFDSLQAQYDTDTSVMTWQTDNLQRNGVLADGFWLVTNDGPNNPKGDDGLAIFYADFNAGGLWAFEYNGQNNPSSYNASEYLGDFSAGVINSGSKRGFSIDVSTIYDALSTDAPFDDQIGIWFHATWGTLTKTDIDGRLAAWDYSAQRYYDRSGMDTEVLNPDPDPVPTPATLPLILLGLIGMRRMQKAR
ncbi:MAG: hypothetical protein AB8C02_09075 [Halioglobus sp.]